MKQIQLHRHRLGHLLKQCIIISLLIVLSSCVAVKEGISHKNVFKTLDEMEFTFHKREKVQYGQLEREYYIYLEPENLLHDDIIFYIHGGGWRNGSPEECLYIGDYFNKLGYRTVLTGYPLIDEVDIHRMNQAVLNSYLDVYKTYSTNSNKIILGGASAGGHLATSLYFDNINRVEIRDKVDKIFSLSGVLDFKQCDNFVINGMINDITKKDNKLAKSLNPLNKITKGLNIDFLILYSENDGIVEFENSTVFADKAKSFGANVELIDVTGLKHDETYVFPFIYSDMYLRSFDNWILN